MKIKFNLTDEVTITNTTVKISAWIQGVINGQDRPTLEAQALDLAKRLFPEVKWGFSNFTYQPDGFTFRVQATTRIDATQNDQLDVRCDSLSEQGKLTISINNIDASIPLHEKRQAESDLRISLIEKAQVEATKLGGKLYMVEFQDAVTRDLLSNARGATYAASAYSLESVSKGGGQDGVSLGHSEKIYLAAEIVVKTEA